MDKPVIQDNRDGTVSIHYEPREEGLHELHVKYNAEHVQGKISGMAHSSIVARRLGPWNSNSPSSPVTMTQYLANNS